MIDDVMNLGSDRLLPMNHGRYLCVLVLGLLLPLGRLAAQEIQESATFRGHEKAVECLAFSPDGTLLATGSRDKTLRLWEVATGKQIASWAGDKGEIYCLAFAPNGKSIATGDSAGLLRVWLVTKGKVTLPRGKKPGEPSLSRSVWGNESYVNSLAFSPDGRALAVVGMGGDIQLVDTSNGLPIRLAYDTPDSVAFSPDGRAVATASRDGVVKLWDPASKEVRFKVAPKDDATDMRVDRVLKMSIVFAPNGKAMFSATASDATVSAWDLVNMQQAPAWTWKGKEVVIYGIAVSPDSSLLAVGSHYPFRNVQSAQTQQADANTLTLRLLDAANGKELASRIGQRQSIVALAFSPDGKLLASGSRHSGEVKLWNTAPFLKPSSAGKARPKRRR